MALRYVMITAILCGFIAGCAKSSSDDLQEQAEEISNNVEGKADHVWNAQVEALDKAKRVGQRVMDAADEQRRAIAEGTE